jgi:hypothetical protein
VPSSTKLRPVSELFVSDAVKILNAGGQGSWSHMLCGIEWINENAARLNIKVRAHCVMYASSMDHIAAIATDTLLLRA